MPGQRTDEPMTIRFDNITPLPATVARNLAQLYGQRASRTDRNVEMTRIDYTNWRDLRAWRVIMPTGRLVFTSNEWHPEPQWLLEAVDVEKGEIRLFAMKGIHAWEPA